MSLSKKKLSKNVPTIIISTSILLAGILLGGFLVLESHQGKASPLDSLMMPKIFKGISSSACVPNPNDKNSDVDHDGLPDWQEQIYSSNPCKKDTDGDGYPDGLEVSAGYDPTKPAPNDELVNRTQKSRGQRNLTLMLAHFLSGNVLAKKIQPSGNSFSGDLKSLSTSTVTSTAKLGQFNLQNQQILSQGINQILPYFKKDITPDLSGLKIIGDSEKLVYQYRRQMDKILGQKPLCSLPKNQEEMEIAYQAMQDKNYILTDCLGDFYQKLFDGMMKMDVPRPAIDIQKTQMRIFYQMSQAFHSIKKIDQDPVRVYLMMKTLQGMDKDLLLLGKGLNQLNQKYP